MQFHKIPFLLFIFSVVSCCSFSQNNTYENYITRFGDTAIKEMEQFGIPASITLAQGILESGAGTSRLATEANNHFGIKCHDWNKEKIYHDDDKKQECFRKYTDAGESFRDHSLFLTERTRYNDLFSLSPTDYKGWAHGLKKAGYATDPKYADRLIDLIERYNLHAYDLKQTVAASSQPADSKKTTSPENAVASNTTAENKAKTSRNPLHAGTISASITHTIRKTTSPFIVAESGDTYGMIADEFGLSVSEVYRFNDLPSHAELKAGDFIYIRPKKNKVAKKDNATHIIKEGESLHSISQFYGIKLKSLFKLNNISEGNKPFIGKKLILR